MSSPGRRARTVVAGAVALLVVLLGWRWLSDILEPTPRRTPVAVAVDVATVERRDVPVYLEGLGTVQAFYTVTATARVDGQIERIGFTEGQDVKKGALLAQIDPRPYQAALDQAIAMRDKDQALLANAERDLARYQMLAPDELASKQTVDTARALVAQLTAQVKVDAAAIASARTQLDYTRITAPISGRTGIRLVDPGNNVHATDTTGIVVLTQLEPISIIFSLPEEAFPALSAALKRGPVPVSALSRDDKEVLDRGTVALIDNQIDQATGTIRIKATLPNKERRLWPGEFVNVRVLSEIRHQALTIPALALERGPEGVFTYVVRPDSTVGVAPLITGAQSGDLVVVEKGLTAGEQVVVSNQYRLQPGALIRASGPAAAKGRVAAPASRAP
jgi:membrane fusion protein, multidrug efflux system